MLIGPVCAIAAGAATAAAALAAAAVFKKRRRDVCLSLVDLVIVSLP
jgi:anti-sigma-K factor RskA